jgi:tRNA C32,U32 (ribose-2'-O)-methylase TrmJ
VTFHPTEAQIDRVLKMAGSDPRKLAIAYLRAQNRLRHAELNSALHEAVADLSMAVMTGDTDKAEKSVRAAERLGRHHAQVSEHGGAA